MTVQSQTAQNNKTSLLASNPQGVTEAGQYLTVTNIVVSKLGFMLSRLGSPGGTVYFAIRQTDGDPGTLIASTAITTGANSITTNTASPSWYQAEFGVPVTISNTIRILVEPTAGITNNFISVHVQLTDVKANENASVYNGGTWQEASTNDYAYFFAYEAATGTASGTLRVSTQAAASIAATTATGNGKLDAFATTAGVTQYGHCWDTATNPSTALATKTTLGASTTLGAFTSGVNLLTPGVLYYVRAYGTDASTTAYGVNVTFTAGDLVSGAALQAGEIAVVQTNLHFVGDDGVEKFITGSAVA